MIIDAIKAMFNAGKHYKTKEKPKRKVSNMMLVLICTMIILYTAANFVL